MRKIEKIVKKILNGKKLNEKEKEIYKQLTAKAVIIRIYRYVTSAGQHEREIKIMDSPITGELIYNEEELQYTYKITRIFDTIEDAEKFVISTIQQIKKRVDVIMSEKKKHEQLLKKVKPYEIIYLS